MKKPNSKRASKGKEILKAPIMKALTPGQLAGRKMTSRMSRGPKRSG